MTIFHGVVNFQNDKGLHAKIKTVFKNVIVLQIFNEKEEFQVQINFYKDGGPWNYRIKKNQGKMGLGVHTLVKPLMGQIDSVIDNHLADKILLE